VLRPFNVYGPGQLGENALQTFVRLALNNDNIQIRGDGDQIRSWIYIDDMVDAILLAMAHKKAIGESFNVGNPRGTISIKTLAELVVTLAGADTRISHTVDSVGAESRSPNIDKAREFLGFEPSVELEEGIRRTIEWRRALNDAS
jgi:dTDP-glucose 4,6-dehydratase